MEEVMARNVALNRLRGRATAWFSKPANIILLAFLVALVVLTLYPLLSLLTETFTVHAGREARAARQSVGEYTLYHFERLFATRKVRFSFNKATVLFDRESGRALARGALTIVS